MKLEICAFSGFKIYPARGKTYVRIDSRVRIFFYHEKKRDNCPVQDRKSRRGVTMEGQDSHCDIVYIFIGTFRFINGKAESYFLQRLNPRKIRWTTIYRRLNKKGVTEEVAKKRSRRTVKHERAIAGASWDAIRAKRNQKPDARAAARQAAIAKSKESKKATQAAKKA